MSGGHNIGLRTWLRRNPQPSAVLADDKRVEVPKGSRPWHELEATIVAMGPAKITLLDGTGSILRVKDLTTDPSPESEPTAVGSDLQTLAKLLADAYEKGAKSYAPLLDNAMAFIERQGQRLASMERDIERLRTLNAKLQADLLIEQSLPEDTGEGGLTNALLAGVLQAQGETPTPIRRKKQEG